MRQFTDCALSPLSPHVLLSCDSDSGVFLWEASHWMPETFMALPQAFRSVVITLFMLRNTCWPWLLLPRELVLLIALNLSP